MWPEKIGQEMEWKEVWSEKEQGVRLFRVLQASVMYLTCILNQRGSQGVILHGRDGGFDRAENIMTAVLRMACRGSKDRAKGAS